MFGTWSDQNPFLVKVLKSSWPPFVPPFFDFPRFDLPVFQAAMTQWETSGFRVIGRLAKSIHGEVAKMVGGWGMLGKLLVLHPSKWVHPSSKWINIKFWGFQHGFNSTHIYIIYNYIYIYIYCIYIYYIYIHIYIHIYIQIYIYIDRLPFTTYHQVDGRLLPMKIGGFEVTRFGDLNGIFIYIYIYKYISKHVYTFYLLHLALLLG